MAFADPGQPLKTAGDELLTDDLDHDLSRARMFYLAFVFRQFFR